MGEHAERVQLSASHHHLRVGKGSAALRYLGTVHHDGGAVAHPCFVFGNEPHGLFAARQLRAEEDGGEAVERDALGTIDHLGR